VSGHNYLSTVRFVEFSPRASDGDVVWAPDREAMKEWFSTLTAKDFGKWTAYARLDRTSPARESGLKPSVEGIYYRIPGEGALSVCAGGPCGKGDGQGPPTVYYKKVSVPQFGTVGILPFRNGWGQTNQVGVSFTPDGGLDNAQYKNTAGDQKVGAFLDQTSSAASGLSSGIRNRKVEGIQAETGVINAETELFKAKRKRQDAEAELKGQ
jgi:hypothetical protein